MNEEGQVNTLEMPKRFLLSTVVVVTCLAFLPFLVVLKVMEAVYLVCDIGRNCMRAAWSDRW